MSTAEKAAAVGAGVLFVILAVPMILGRVRPNWLYGVRTKETLSDEAVWYEVNRKSGWGFLVLGVLVTASALLIDREIVWGSVAVGGALIWGAWSVWLGRSANRSRMDRDGG